MDSLKGSRTVNERQAFRIDVCGHQYSLPSEQPTPAYLDSHLRQLAQPFSQTLCALAVDLAPVVADAVEAHLDAAPPPPSPIISTTPTARRQRRRTGTPARPRALRKRVSLMTTVAMAERQHLAASVLELCDGQKGAADAPVNAISAMFALLSAELRDALPDAASSAGAAARQIARAFTAVATVDESRRRSESDGVVEFAGAPHQLDADPDSADFDSAESLVGIFTAREDAAEPFSTGLVEYLIAGMNRHARTRPNVRHAWAAVFTCGTVRFCLLESDAIHVTSELDLGTRDGRRALAEIYTGLCLSEPWRLGADPSMRWRADIERWEIECPADVSDPHADPDELPRPGARRLRRSARFAPPATSMTVYAQRSALFTADSFFGRFTRCFAAARTPTAEPDLVLKDSWQLVPDNCSSCDDEDEIAVLDRIRTRMDAAQSDAVFPRLLCGGTVRIDTSDAAAARDTSLLILDDLDAYTRWTVPHGFRKEDMPEPTTPLQPEAPRLRRLHRRMVSGPVGQPLQALKTEHDVVAVLADAMHSHTEILRHAHILHRDISLNNIMAVRIGNELRGMLIDFDHGVDIDAVRNQKLPGNVGTGPFMSIANLEGLDVPRTAVDDWESLICLLFCLAAKSSEARDEMGHIFAHVNAHGAADVKREMFQTTAALDSVIARFLNPSYLVLIRLIRELHTAIFMHARCQGTAQISLRSNRQVDPVQRRVQYAEEIHARCQSALAKVAADSRSMSTLSDHMASISHQCCDLRRARAPLSQPCESTESLSTLLDVAPESLHSPHLCSRSTSDTLTDSRPDLRHLTKAQLMQLLEDEELAMRKRKAKGEQADSPRTKRRKMIHSAEHCDPPIVQLSSTRALSFVDLPASVHLPPVPPVDLANKRKRFSA
ncbi:hypothetical protein IW147_003857 [Coemansia sp. RSA 720]|nr:hypothetical protein LPJ76_001967 [Coemansia sp. RSA 638]KAJ2121868.1 hypothetical protein IW147_003857 [Coemansia sp. RSA 720]KAJ2543414.1 hypothetical protein GGF49_002117 [Coemansia sp. RSA 1853]